MVAKNQGCLLNKYGKGQLLIINLCYREAFCFEVRKSICFHRYVFCKGRKKLAMIA